MPVVQNTVRDPGGDPVYPANVTITLIAAVGGHATGYTATGDVITSYVTTTDPTGHWSATLTGNADITPANTYYLVSEAGWTSPIVVPAGGGPYDLRTILAVPPPVPSPPGLTAVEVAANGTVAGSRPELNLVAGTNTTVTAVDNPGANRVDVTIASTGGGGAGTVKSVNSLLPDGAGNVQLSATDVAAVALAGNQTVAGVKTFTSAPVVPAASFPESAVVNLVTDLASKAADAAVVHNTGPESVAGVKTFTSAPVVPAAAFPESAVAGLTADLAARELAANKGAAGGYAALNSATRVLPAELGQAPVNLADAATIVVDATLSNQFRVTLGAAVGATRVLGNPTGAFDMQVLVFSVKQDVTGSRAMTLDTKYRFGTDITSITLTTTPSKTDKLSVQYHLADDRFDVIAFVRGF